MFKESVGILACSTSLMFVATLAVATSNKATLAKTKEESTTDTSFITKANQGGMEEVELGKLASQKAIRADVKSFGQEMVTDHGKADVELRQLAENKKIDLPSTLDAAHRAEVDRLSRLSGKEFDRIYVRLMVKDHDHDVAGFKKGEKSVKDPDLQAWISKTLPTLEHHQSMIHKISKEEAGG
jgi:putative membrane protein